METGIEVKEGKLTLEVYKLKFNTLTYIHTLHHSPDPAAKEWDFELVGQQQQQQQRRQDGGSSMALPGMELALSNSFGFGGVNVSLLFRRCT